MLTVPAKQIVLKNKNNWWFGSDYNMNIYRGCSHGCIYCDSRSDCYQNANFEEIKVKKNALEIIRNDLRRKIKKGVVGTGSMSDPYNPYEKVHAFTRNALKLLFAYDFGVAITTKSNLIKRDLDILLDIKRNNPVITMLTITDINPIRSKKIEPKVSTVEERFQALQVMADAGIFTGIVLMPVLPYINDTWDNIDQIIKETADRGGKFIYPYLGLTLRAGQREYFYQCLEKDFPGIKEKYLHQYGTTYSCLSPNVKKLMNQLKEACDKLGILFEMNDIIRKMKT